MSVGAGPDRRPLFAEASSKEMRNTRFDNLRSSRPVRKAPNLETSLSLAALAFGLAMLSLLAVLLLADTVALSHILPFFALPLVLFIATAPLFRRWVKREAEETAIAEVAHRALQPPPPSLRCASTDEFDTPRHTLKSTAATRR
jgi:hypothetical protein